MVNNILPIIYGPTAVGKTSLALQLTQKQPSDIISADSRQIYRDLNIGTGKDLPSGSRFIKKKLPSSLALLKCHWGYWQLPGGPRIWLLDLISPRQKFNAVKWSQAAGWLVKNALQAGRRAIIVGGSAFYIKVLIDGISDFNGQSQTDWRQRQAWEKLPLSALQQKLKKRWLKRWQELNDSDRQNKRRLIRSLEIAKTQRRHLPLKRKKFIDKSIIIRGIGLFSDWEMIKKLIRLRIAQRLESGLLPEISKLFEQGYDWTMPGLNSLAYREWKDFFTGQASLKETVSLWQRDEIAYARRQRLWFRNDDRFHWFNAKKLKIAQINDYLQPL